MNKVKNVLTDILIVLLGSFLIGGLFLLPMIITFIALTLSLVLGQDPLTTFNNFFNTDSKEFTSLLIVILNSYLLIIIALLLDRPRKKY